MSEDWCFPVIWKQIVLEYCSSCSGFPSPLDSKLGLGSARYIHGALVMELDHLLECMAGGSSLTFESTRVRGFYEVHLFFISVLKSTNIMFQV